MSLGSGLIVSTTCTDSSVVSKRFAKSLSKSKTLLLMFLKSTLGEILQRKIWPILEKFVRCLIDSSILLIKSSAVVLREERSFVPASRTRSKWSLVCLPRQLVARAIDPQRLSPLFVSFTQCLSATFIFLGFIRSRRESPAIITLCFICGFGLQTTDLVYRSDLLLKTVACLTTGLCSK